MCACVIWKIVPIEKHCVIHPNNGAMLLWSVIMPLTKSWRKQTHYNKDKIERPSSHQSEKKKDLSKTRLVRLIKYDVTTKGSQHSIECIRWYGFSLYANYDEKNP